MKKQQKIFSENLFNKYDPADIKGITKELKQVIKQNPGKMSLVPTSLRTVELCKYLIKVSPFGFEGVKKYIPRDIWDKVN